MSPIPKVPTPKNHTDYTPVKLSTYCTHWAEFANKNTIDILILYSSALQRPVIGQFLYPIFITDVSQPLTFSDIVFLHSPTGSGLSHNRWMLHSVRPTRLLFDNDYVIHVALDVSKAFIWFDTPPFLTYLPFSTVLNFW